MAGSDPQDIVRTIYRVQDKDGRGPFKPGFSHKWIKVRAAHDDLKPWFSEFGAINRKVRSGFRCGSACLSISKLRIWFTREEYATLQSLGYQAVKMDADILAESFSQCFFERERPLAEAIQPIELYSK